MHEVLTQPPLVDANILYVVACKEDASTKGGCMRYYKTELKIIRGELNDSPKQIVYYFIDQVKVIHPGTPL